MPTMADSELQYVKVTKIIAKIWRTIQNSQIFFQKQKKFVKLSKNKQIFIKK